MSEDKGFTVTRCAEGLKAIEILEKSSPVLSGQWTKRKEYWRGQMKFALARVGQEG